MGTFVTQKETTVCGCKVIMTLDLDAAVVHIQAWINPIQPDHNVTIIHEVTSGLRVTKWFAEAELYLHNSIIHVANLQKTNHVALGGVLQ